MRLLEGLVQLDLAVAVLTQMHRRARDDAGDRRAGLAARAAHVEESLLVQKRLQRRHRRRNVFRELARVCLVFELHADDALVLNGARDGFVLSGNVADQVFDPTDTLSLIQFGSGFGAVTDIETGPDNAVYVLSLTNATIYRLSSTVSNVGGWQLY